MENRKYTTIIVDDEKLARDSIRTLLNNRSNWQVIGEANTANKAIKSIESLLPDVVFMDIEMPGKSSIDALREANFTKWPQVVFVTAYNQFAIEAFEVNAIDYLLKPYSDQKFFRSLEKVEKMLVQTEKATLNDNLTKLLDFYEKTNSPKSTEYTERFAVKSIGKIEIVPVANVQHIQASGSYSELHTAKGKFLMNESISTIEQSLDPSVFVRIHRSTIVKIREVAELITHYNGEFIVHLRSGARLKLSRSYKQNLDRLTGTNI